MLSNKRREGASNKKFMSSKKRYAHMKMKNNKWCSTEKPKKI